MTSVSDLIIGSEGKSVSYHDECYSRIVIAFRVQVASLLQYSLFAQTKLN